MAQSAVTGSGPVRIINAQGQMSLIPLTDLHFDNGVVTADSKWNGLSALPAYLGYLAKSGQIKPAAGPPPKAGLILNAAGEGAVYNGVVVKFANVNATTQKFDVTVTKINAYTGLSWDSASPNFAPKILGVETDPRKGLVYAGGSPGKVKAIAGDPLTGGSSSDAAKIAINDGGSVFNLFAFNKGAAGNEITIEIPSASINTTAKTFDLTATWTKTRAAISISQFKSDTDFKYLIAVADPPLPLTAALPRADTVVLMGGADVTSAVTAEATAYAA